MVITKISIDKQKFYDIDGTLDLDNRVIDFNLSFDKFEDVFGFKARELFLHPERINENRVIYVCDDNGIYYSCFNCIFGFKYSDPLHIYSAPIDFIIENMLTDTKDVDINKLTLKTSFPKKYVAYIADMDFKYSKNKKVSIKKSFDNEKLIINYTIESDEKVKYEKLSTIVYSVLELTFLLLGDIPKIEEVSMMNDSEIKLYFENAQKYIQRNNIYRSSSNGILGYLENKKINGKVIKKFLRFRKDTKILFDLLMIHINGDGYLEMTNSMLVQLLEGFYKTMNPGINKDLREILNEYFISNSEIATLMVKRDLKDGGDFHHTPIFLLKAKEHRHYLSHLNMNESKKVFYQLENIYANWKLCLCLRIYIMQYLSIDVDEMEFDKTKSSIEKWARSHHLRYKK